MTQQRKIDIAKKVIDALTVAFLAAAFALAFATGFVIKNDYNEFLLKPEITLLITSLGIIVLFCAGSVSALIARIKRKENSVGFLVLLVLEILSMVAYIGLAVASVGALDKDVFYFDTPLVRAAYIIAALFVLIGYADSVVLAEKLEGEESEGKTAEDEEAFEEDEDSDEAEEEEEDDAQDAE